MIAKRLIWIFSVLALVISAPVYAGKGRGPGFGGSSALSPAEIADLKFMREEEKLARDVYDELYEHNGMLIFARIGGSEQNHMDAMLNLLIKYKLNDPAAGNLRGEFENTTLDALYDNLVSDQSGLVTILDEPETGGKVSRLAALYVGAWIEERDMLDIMAAISRTNKTDIVRVYTNLLCGSRSHLRAFVGQIGTGYEAQILLEPADVTPSTDPQETIDYWLGAASDEICG